MLVAEDRRLFRQMLSRLSWMTPWPPADAYIALDLARPEVLLARAGNERALLDERLIREQLIFGWDLVFRALRFEDWQARAAEWIGCAAGQACYRDAMLDVLVTAAAARPGTLARLFAMTRVPALREIVSGPLFQKINIAQGFEIA
jgi:hypothetical protein